MYRIPSDEPCEDYFGRNLVPTLDELRSKAVLVIPRGHHSLTTLSPLAPEVKEVDGIHIPISGPAELPRELEGYLDSAVQGAVYFNAGSARNAITTFPDKILAIFCPYPFAQILERVPWK